MIDKEILKKIIYFTDEEIDNLNGKNKIDRSIYVAENSDVIDAHKLLNKNEKISVRKHARFREYPKHSHNFIELTYIYSGTLTHIVDDHEIVLNKGEFIMYDQNVSHSVKFAEENDIAFNIIILPEYIEYLTPLLENQNEISNFLFHSIFNYDNSGMYMVFKVGDSLTINNIMDRLLTNLYLESNYKEVMNKLILGELLIKLAEKQEKIFMENRDSYDASVIHEITKYIKTSFKDANLKDLENILHMNDYQICKLIKKSTGKTFKELVQIERMKQTKKLLLTSNLSIMEIMNIVGYDNSTYFYKVFNNYYGMTPKEYKKNSR